MVKATTSPIGATFHLVKMIYQHLVKLILCFLMVQSAHTSRPFDDAQLFEKANNEGDIWALLIAGSAGWGNYRHQADVAHAYHVLKQGGIKDSNIIVMVYNDIAFNDENPTPGTIINHPEGKDLYEGLVIDYSRSHVNVDNFLAVLGGNKSAIEVGPHSNGRVIEAGPKDRLFVYYSDHGAPGVIGMPSGPFLYADQLHHVIKHRKKAAGFKEMVLYIEACESGSMFEGLLSDDLNILAVTAANGHESSWGTYCPGMNPPPPLEYSTCLGDLFSVAWMEDSDVSDLRVETLKKQFQLVKARTSSNFTYMQGSHVMRYGDYDIDEEPAGDFLGMLNDGVHNKYASYVATAAYTPVHDAIPQRSADLMPLMIKAQRAQGTPAETEAQRLLDTELAKRATLDTNVRSMLSTLFTTQQLQSFYPEDPIATVATQEGGEVATAMSLGMEAFMTRPLPSRLEGSALVDNWDCLRAMVSTWESACGPLDQYGMQHTRSFANLCNVGVEPIEVAGAAGKVCAAAAAAAAAAVVAVV